MRWFFGTKVGRICLSVFQMCIDLVLSGLSTLHTRQGDHRCRQTGKFEAGVVRCRNHNRACRCKPLLAIINVRSYGTCCSGREVRTRLRPMTPSATEERPNNTLDQMITCIGSIGYVDVLNIPGGSMVAYGSTRQDGDTKKLLVQLLSAADPSIEEDRSPAGRWRDYVATYVTEHPTEWVPAGRAKKPLFLRRYVMILRCIYSGGVWRYVRADLRPCTYL